jgi:guanylate kinase
MAIGEENLLVILSSPSGVGKTTLTKKIQQKYNNFKISVSHTTRKPRSNEIDGVDYHFVSLEKFKELIASNSFYEYAKIYENYYGTLKESVDKTLKNNDVIFDIDWQGTKQLSNFKKLKLVKIYLITHNKNELKKRLLNRDQNTNIEIKKRFDSFDEDVKHWNDYDYILINKNLEVCFKQIETIINNFKRKKSISFQ